MLPWFPVWHSILPFGIILKGYDGDSFLESLHRPNPCLI